MNFSNDTITANGSQLEVAAGPVFVVFSSDLEYHLTLLYLSLAGSIIFLGNICFVTTIFRHPKFHTPQYAILVSFSFIDITVVFAGLTDYFTMAVWQLDTPLWVCRAFSALAIGAFFAGAYQIGAIAWERYMYFCRPLQYPRLVNKVTVGLVLGIVVWGLPFFYIMVTELVQGRIFLISLLACQLGYPEIHAPIQFAVCLLPSLIITVFATVKIYRLISGLSVGPAPMQGDHDKASSANQMTAKTAVKMILLVAGAFWGTYIPGYLFRIIVFLSGYTWMDFNTRKYVALAILVRANNMFLSHASAMLNPVIYFMTNTEVRHAFRRMVGLKVTNAANAADSGGTKPSSTGIV